MNMCYNQNMRKLFLLISILLVLLSSKVFAAGFEVVVLPVSAIDSRENYYNFNNVDEIFANDIINIFNSSNKVHSPELFVLNAKLSSNSTLKSTLNTALSQYKTTRRIDYSAMKLLANAMNARSVLIISAVSEGLNGKVKKDVWESLNVSSSFDIAQDNVLRIDVVLLDNVNDLVMWSGVYNLRLSDNSGRFQAENYSEAIEHLEKIKLFSKNLLSRTISQNVLLRFYPKSITPVDVKPIGESIDSGLLKFNKNIPSIHRFGNSNSKQEKDKEEENYGEMIFQL